MNKLIVTLLIISPQVIFAATKLAPSKPKISRVSQMRLSALISTFDINTQEGGDLQIELSNTDGLKKSEALTNKTEQFQEYTKYSISNPFADDYKLDFFVFEKIKPTMSDSSDSPSEDLDLSEVSVNLMVLIDSATKKTIKSKAQVYYKDSLIGEGSLENNSQIRINDDLSAKVKNCKIQELKVVKNLLGADKRSLDLEVRYTQGKKSLKQKLNVTLLNMKQTPIEPVKEDPGTEEGTEDEDETTHS